jgi:hypothetical protein
MNRVPPDAECLISKTDPARVNRLLHHFASMAASNPGVRTFAGVA